MAPKFPNPDPATDSVRDRLNQFIEVAGRAVYPPLAVAPSPATPGQIWWDITDTVKIRDEANAAWADLLTVLGGQPAGSYQPAGGYVRYDESQTLTSAQMVNASKNAGVFGAGYAVFDRRASRNFGVTYTNTKPWPIHVSVSAVADSSSRKITLLLNGVLSSWFENPGSTVAIWATVSGFVPPGSTYRVDVVGQVPTEGVQVWTEYDLT